LPTHWPRDAPAIRRADLPPWRGQADGFLTSLAHHEKFTEHKVTHREPRGSADHDGRGLAGDG